MLNSIPHKSENISHMDVWIFFTFTMWTYTGAYATVLFL